MPPTPPIPPGWLIELPTCPSTNTWALDHAEALASGACVFTRRQTAGRGQPGSRWTSPEGVLTASYILHTTTATPLALIAGLAVAHASEDHAPSARVQLKWPNDCLVNDRKLAGILCERADSGATVVGIGLNLDPRWDQSPETLPLAADRRFAPISVAELAGPAGAPDCITMLMRLRRYLLEGIGLLAANGWPRLLAEIQARDALLGRRLAMETSTGPLTGTAAGINADGRLLIDTGSTTLAIASARQITLL
jgi:BirA family biotin operon repressor/biotin-[acetyl-CoA-carboxylase] ligase